MTGAGGHGRSAVEVILLLGRNELIGLVDDGAEANAKVWSYPMLGRTDSLHRLRERADAVVVAVGNNAVREKLHVLVRDTGFELLNVIHSAAFVLPSATLGVGCVVMAGAIVGMDAWLGEGVIVNCGATVDHHCRGDALGHLGVNASMAGGSGLAHRAWSRLEARSAMACRWKVAQSLRPARRAQPEPKPFSSRPSERQLDTFCL